MKTIGKTSKITVRLPEEYSIINGKIHCFSYDSENDDYDYAETSLAIGSIGVLYSRKKVGKRKTMHFKLSDEGISGNSNSNIKRYHGWRGTTNDVSIDAFGQREIVGYREVDSKVLLYLSDDLHPDW